ncbi:unnamed protein product [Adineta ricciae]|uniref:Lebercilin domain-containing protein n=1 Tax=Adineta ricciae TaxID=249248 RepID=A0A815JBV3_ADIRI|nr:unnamed protein product [Adineta ricciae]
METQRAENSTLRTIQKREEKAIRNYEEKEYDIHRIVQHYTKEVEHIKRVLSSERETKVRLEKQIEARDEKLQDQTKRLKQYEKIVQEKHLDERYDLREKLNETDKKLEELQEKLSTQQKYIENLEKNHRYEVNQELAKQRDLKRELDVRSKKYNDLVQKFEEKTRQMDTMHIYAQRGGLRPSDTPATLAKSRSLQSLNEPSPRVKEKTIDLDKKKREQHEPERKPKARQQPPPPPPNDDSPKGEKKKVITKKEQLPPPAAPITKSTSSNDRSSNVEKPSTTQNGHLPPKGKPPARRLSTPISVDEVDSEVDDDDDFFGSSPKKLPLPTTNQRSEQNSSNKDSQKRPAAPVPPAHDSKYKSTGTGGDKAPPSSTTLKTVDPPVASKSRVTRDLDEKWSDMFGTSKQDTSAKEDLLAKLVADEQQERKAATSSRPPPAATTTTENSSVRTSTTTAHPTTTTSAAKPSVDPFESLFSNNSQKPGVPRSTDPEDIFSTKPSNQPPARQNRNESFDSLFGPSSTTHNNSSTITSNSKQIPSQNDKLQRPKVVTNGTRPIPNRTVIDEVEEFVL